MKQKISRYGAKYILSEYFFQFLSSALMFIAAGTLFIGRLWIFLIILFSFKTVNFVIIYNKSANLLNRRGQKFKDTEKFDKYLLPVYLLFSVFLLKIVAGFDVGRYKISNVSELYILLGLLIVIIGNSIVLWAMIANRHFEPTTRLQKDQKVICSGPYKYVRHPGYSAAILWDIGSVLILGSFLTFIPFAIAICLIILRTHLEDKILQKKLEGYKKYTKKVRYRILPGIW